jgi:hypothetical protein
MASFTLRKLLSTITIVGLFFSLNNSDWRNAHVYEYDVLPSCFPFSFLFRSLIPTTFFIIITFSQNPHHTHTKTPSKFPFGVEIVKTIPVAEKAVGEMRWLGAEPAKSAPKAETEGRPQPPEGWEAAFAKLQTDYNTLLAGSRAEAANKEKVRIIKPLHGGTKKLTQRR